MGRPKNQAKFKGLSQGAPSDARTAKRSRRPAAADDWMASPRAQKTA